ncbi:MAG: sulfite exporter TauE/SafE family protein [Pseudomonadales bacterium]
MGDRALNAGLIAKYADLQHVIIADYNTQFQCARATWLTTLKDPLSLEALFGVNAPQLLFLYAVVIAASVLRSFTGFGFALAAVPGFSWVLAPTDAVVLSAGLALAISFMGLGTYWGLVSFKSMRPMLLMSVLGTVIGASLLSFISVKLFQLLIAVSIFVACTALTQVKASQPFRCPTLGWIAGLSSGLMNGALAIPGPPVIVFALLTQPDPARSRALLMTFFMLSALVALCTFTVSGFVRLPTIYLFLAVLPVLYLSNKVGYVLFSRYSGLFYRRIAMLALLAMGASILVRVVWFSH